MTRFRKIPFLANLVTFPDVLIAKSTERYINNEFRLYISPSNSQWSPVVSAYPKKRASYRLPCTSIQTSTVMTNGSKYHSMYVAWIDMTLFQ